MIWLLLASLLQGFLASSITSLNLVVCSCVGRNLSLSGSRGVWDSGSPIRAAPIRTLVALGPVGRLVLLSDLICFWMVDDVYGKDRRMGFV